MRTICRFWAVPTIHAHWTDESDLAPGVWGPIYLKYLFHWPLGDRGKMKHCWPFLRSITVL